MAGLLSADLVQRLRQRAQDPVRRSGDATLAAQAVSVEDLLRVQRQEATQPGGNERALDEYIRGMNTPFAGMVADSVSGDDSRTAGLLGALGSLMGGSQLFAMSGQGVVSMGAASAPAPAPAPASEAELAAAERELGFALPADLRQAYVEVADGGFGPGGGLYSVAGLVAKYREMTTEPVGPQGQPWPAELLPLQGDDWDLVCFDRASGRLVYWDLEELDDDDELAPDQPTWAASFVPEADSLEAWLSDWAGSD